VIRPAVLGTILTELAARAVPTAVTVSVTVPKRAGTVSTTAALVWRVLGASSPRSPPTVQYQPPPAASAISGTTTPS